jgi:hypothetical protein
MKRDEQVNAPLWQLDQRIVGIWLLTNGRRVLIKGRATYERDPQLGPILRVCLSRQHNSEVLFAEREWKGKIVSGKGKDYDFVIALN